MPSKKVNDAELKVATKIQSFEDVQRALQDIEKSLKSLSTSVNSQAEGEITDKDGKTGDIRVTQNEDKTYGLELKTEEGWKFPTVGESPVQLSGKKGEKARPDAVVDKFKDELGGPSNFPNPDYQSEWVNVPNNRIVPFTHGLGVIPTLVILEVTNDGGETIHHSLHHNSGNANSTIYTKEYIWIAGVNTWGWIYNTLGWDDKNVFEQSNEWDTLDLYVDNATQKYQFRVKAWK